MNQFFIPGPDGKPVFLGKEDIANPPTKKPEGSKMECPVCHGQFDFLVGENTHDGGVMGCELCWKPPKGKRSYGKEEGTKEAIFD